MIKSGRAIAMGVTGWCYIWMPFIRFEHFCAQIWMVLHQLEAKTKTFAQDAYENRFHTFVIKSGRAIAMLNLPKSKRKNLMEISPVFELIHFLKVMISEKYQFQKGPTHPVGC